MILFTASSAARLTSRGDISSEDGVDGAAREGWPLRGRGCLLPSAWKSSALRIYVYSNESMSSTVRIGNTGSSQDVREAVHEAYEA